jgi:hypothetical protein
MWRALAAVVAAGCTFRPSAGSASADAALDVPADAAPACQLVVGTQMTSAAALGGGGGGSPQPDATCPPGALPVGFAFDMSQGANTNNQHVVVTFHVRCGRIARTAAGRVATTPTMLVDVNQSGGPLDCLFGWGKDSGSELWCPTGQAIVGMTGNAAASSLYNTVAMQCQGIDDDGQLAGAITTIAFGNTYAYANQPEIATCPAGTAVARFAIRAGCGQDETTPACAPVSCQ